MRYKLMGLHFEKKVRIEKQFRLSLNWKNGFGALFKLFCAIAISNECSAQELTDQARGRIVHLRRNAASDLATNQGNFSFDTPQKKILFKRRNGTIAELPVPSNSYAVFEGNSSVEEIEDLLAFRIAELKESKREEKSTGICDHLMFFEEELYNDVKIIERLAELASLKDTECLSKFSFFTVNNNPVVVDSIKLFEKLTREFESKHALENYKTLPEDIKKNNRPAGLVELLKAPTVQSLFEIVVEDANFRLNCMAGPTGEMPEYSQAKDALAKLISPSGDFMASGIVKLSDNQVDLWRFTQPHPVFFCGNTTESEIKEAEKPRWERIQDRLVADGTIWIAKACKDKSLVNSQMAAAKASLGIWNNPKVLQLALPLDKIENYVEKGIHFSEIPLEYDGRDRLDWVLPLLKAEPKFYSEQLLKFVKSGPADELWNRAQVAERLEKEGYQEGTDFLMNELSTSKDDRLIQFVVDTYERFWRLAINSQTKTPRDTSLVMSYWKKHPIRESKIIQNSAVLKDLKDHLSGNWSEADIRQIIERLANRPTPKEQISELITWAKIDDISDQRLPSNKWYTVSQAITYLISKLPVEEREKTAIKTLKDLQTTKETLSTIVPNIGNFLSYDSRQKAALPLLSSKDSRERDIGLRLESTGFTKPSPDVIKVYNKIYNSTSDPEEKKRVGERLAQ